MPKRTNPFQNLSASIMAAISSPDFSVKESVLERSITGKPREIDIIITEINNPTNKKLVECRDHKRRQTVEWIEQLFGKAHSLAYKKVIAVSSSGFSEDAMKMARLKQIEIMHLRDAEKKDWASWLFSMPEFGVDIDLPPIVRKVDLVSSLNVPNQEGDEVNISDIYFIDNNKKRKFKLSDYIAGLINDPKIVNYVRENNTKEAISHYTYEVPCDPGIGYTTNGRNFIPLQKVIFHLDSARRSYKIPLKHIRAGDHKIMVGEEKILGVDSRLVLEEKEGQLVVMIEQKISKDSGQ